MKLLEYATSRVCASRRGEPSTNPAVLHMGKKFPRYEQLPTAADLRAFGAVVDAARAAGAVSFDIGDAEAATPRIRKIECSSADALSSFLNVTPYWLIVEAAEVAFQPHFEQWPILRDLVAAWWNQKSPQGLKPEAAQTLLDAILVLERGRGADIPARRLSARLFSDSKKVEALTRELDILANGSLTEERRDPNQVLSDLGILRFPPVTLMSNATFMLSNGRTMPAEWPFIGTAPDTIAHAELAPGVEILLLVENLTTFNEIARAGNGFASHVAALYTGGAPAPSLLAFLKRSLSRLPPHIRVYHWGDVDLGGYRIADKVAEACHQVGHLLQLWQMPPAQLPAGYAAKAIERSDLKQILAITVRRGWSEPGQLEIEQEAIDPMVPPLAAQAS